MNCCDNYGKCQCDPPEDEDKGVEMQMVEGICPACDGSGEGMYDGTTCRSCRGKGTEWHEE